MSGRRWVDVVVTTGFLAVIFSPGLIQCAVELHRGQRPGALDVLVRRPSAESLRAYENSLEDESWTVQRLRPWMQYLQFALLNDAGGKALTGLDGWLFYRPGVEYVIAGGRIPAGPAPGRDPFAAIAAFRDELALRGIRLVVVPVPNKESVYPDKVTRRAAGQDGTRCRRTSDLLERLCKAGVETVDLFAVFAETRQRQPEAANTRLYLVQDSHWSPAGVAVAAGAAAERILKQGWVGPGTTDYDALPIHIERIGDVLQMLQAPWVERAVRPEPILCYQVIQGDGTPYADDPDSEVLVIGDSFLRIYQTDEPGNAGFIAHLARALGRPVTSLVGDGGASTLVRQELYRRAGLLKNKKVVVWEFVERDIELGAEGWQIVPLPHAGPQ